MTLETLEKRFPFGKYAEQAQIELVYAYYKSVNYEQAILAAERFISLHPRHPNVDYAYYIKGLAKFNNDKDLFASAPFLGEMTHKRELAEAKESFEDLSSIGFSRQISAHINFFIKLSPGLVEVFRIDELLEWHALARVEITCKSVDVSAYEIESDAASDLS